MNKGRSIVELAAELQRQVETRKDYLADTRAIELRFASRTTEQADAGTPSGIVLAGINAEEKGINDLAHGQIAAHTEIPKGYYDRMLAEDPALLATNVNTWLHRTPAKRLVRTLDGRVRAFLSNKFRPLDNLGLAEAALPTLVDMGAEIESAELTERRLYIKATFPKLSDQVPEGLTLGVGHHRIDTVIAGIVISNSEVGAGSLRIEPAVKKYLCTNLLISAESSMRKYHIGRQADVEHVRELLSDEAKHADDKAVWLAVRDVVRGAANPAVFAATVAKMKAAAETPMGVEAADIPAVVEVLTKRMALPERSAKSILTHLIEGGDLSKWGMVNAVTRSAEDEKDYEVSTDLERAGGKVLDLSPTEWRTLTAAA